MKYAIITDKMQKKMCSIVQTFYEIVRGFPAQQFLFLVSKRERSAKEKKRGRGEKEKKERKKGRRMKHSPTVLFQLTNDKRIRKGHVAFICHNFSFICQTSYVGKHE